MGRPRGSTNRNKKANGRDPESKVTRHDNLASVDPLTEEQLEALTSSHVDIIDRMEAAKKLADANFKNAYKTAKADGILKKDIDAYRKARTEEGQEELRIEEARIQRVARWFKFAIQPDLFAPGAEPAPVGNRSYRVGREAGLAGEKAAPSTDMDIDTYMAGWSSGQRDMASLGIKQTPADDFN